MSKEKEQFINLKEQGDIMQSLKEINDSRNSLRYNLLNLNSEIKTIAFQLKSFNDCIGDIAQDISDATGNTRIVNTILGAIEKNEAQKAKSAKEPNAKKKKK